MKNLYETKYCVWDNNRPKHAVENAINYKTDTTQKIDKPYLP